MYSRIVSTGHFVPERILTNRDLERMVNTSDEWIQSRTGIRERHIVSDGETNLDLCEQAARRALEAADLTPGDLDLILVATTTPNQVFPNMGVLLQERLGGHGYACFSLEAACTGFIYALSVANSMIQTGQIRRALVVGGETLSRITDYTDRSTCILFGDGAGAVILEASPDAGFLSVRIHADGMHKDLLYFPSGISQGFDRLRDKRDFIQMRGNEVFRVAVNTLCQIAQETLDAAGVGPDELSWLVPHQANLRIIEAIARKLALPMERVVLTIGEHGNTSTASIPMALDVAVRDGRIQRGQLLLFEAFGGGFTWGSALVRF
ncbi:3-oxoacyl-(acyl-carrier-protein) synthase III [mine drainage metagenome]|uniref:beta-ketoacyl-[acyl-carrier-protein] synthase III n=1 Tax=mine drainage metagenome TaxID=410659 RepID=T1BTD2_9ZZZZ